MSSKTEGRQGKKVKEDYKKKGEGDRKEIKLNRRRSRSRCRRWVEKWEEEVGDLQDLRDHFVCVISTKTPLGGGDDGGGGAEKARRRRDNQLVLARANLREAGKRREKIKDYRHRSSNISVSNPAYDSLL